MPVPAGRFPLLAAALAAALALGGCASKPTSELAATSEPAAKPDAKPEGKPDDKPSAAPGAARKPADADSDPGPPLLRHEAAGQCWVIADKRGGSIEAKTKIVDKCIDDKLKADAAKRGAAN